MKALRIKHSLLHFFKTLPRSTRKKITSYLSVAFVIGAMVLFFILSKKSTVDTRQLVAEWHSVNNNDAAPVYSLLEEKWIRVDIAFRYLQSLNSAASSIQKQVAVNEVIQAQADMDAQLQAMQSKAGDVNAKHFIQAYSNLLGNSKSLLAAAFSTKPKSSIMLDNNDIDIKDTAQKISNSILKNQLDEKSKQVETLQEQLKTLSSAANKTAVNNAQPDATIASLKTQLAYKAREADNLKKQLQKQNKPTAAPGTGSVAMFDYTSKNVEELQKQVKFFDWASKDMARQNDALKKEIEDLKSRKVVINQ